MSCDVWRRCSFFLSSTRRPIRWVFATSFLHCIICSRSSTSVLQNGQFGLSAWFHSWCLLFVTQCLWIILTYCVRLRPRIFPRIPFMSIHSMSLIWFGVSFHLELSQHSHSCPTLYRLMLLATSVVIRSNFVLIDFSFGRCGIILRRPNNPNLPMAG